MKDKIEHLIESLASEDQKLRDDAAKTLVDIGLPAIKFLIQALKTKDDYIKIIVTRILGRMGSQVFEDIVLLLKYDEPSVRQSATMVLKEITDSRAIEPLLKAFNDENPQVRWGALVALGEIGFVSFDFLIRATKDPYWNIRATAAKFLEATKDPRAIEPLIELLKDKDSSVKSHIVSIWHFSDWLKDERAVEPIIALFKEESCTLREAAVGALGKLKNPKAVEPLINLLKDKDWMVREKAIWALKEIKDNRAVEPLILALKDEIRKVREMAARALGEINESIAIIPLKKALIEEKSMGVKSSIEVALCRLEGKEKGGEINDQSQNRTKEVKESTIDLIINKAQDKEVQTVPIYKNNESINSDEFFNNIKKLFYEQIMPTLKENPGILQKDLYKKGFNSSTFYYMAKVGFIRREKVGNSFKLFLPNEMVKDEVKKFLLRSWDERVKIPVEVYQDSKKRIFEYFGRDTLKQLFEYSEWHYQMWKDYNQEFGDLRDESSLVKQGWKVIHNKKNEGDYLYSQKEDNYYVDRFLVDIGACLKFDVNEPLERLINKYWTKDCDEKLKKFYSKYGFFSVKYFVEHELERILGKERFMDFYAGLEAQAHTFKIKWCGFLWNYVQSTHIPWDYAQHLRFKWGLKPEIYLKECVYCGNSFYPFYYASIFYPYSTYFPQIINYFPIEDSIKEVNFCLKHFPISSYGTFLADEIKSVPTVKERMKGLLKELIDTLEFIPPKHFHKSLYYLKGIPKKNFDDAVRIISNMPPFEKEVSTQPKGYKDIFGSWLKALDAAGVLEGGVRRTSRGYVCLAKDGHECRSIGEKIIDDYLFTRNISHEQEPHYPGERQFRADWRVGEYFIEFWGLKGEEDYDIKMEEKRAIAQQYQIPLIEICFDDLRNLGDKFKDIIT